MLNALRVTTTARIGRNVPKGRVRPASTTAVVILRTATGYESACTVRYGRATRDPLTSVPSRLGAIRAAQHEAGAFVPEPEWREPRTTGYLAGDDRGGLKWQLHSARNGSFLVIGSAPCGWDGMFHQRYSGRGRRAGVRALQHAIRRGEVRGGTVASHEEESY